MVTLQNNQHWISRKESWVSWSSKQGHSILTAFLSFHSNKSFHFIFVLNWEDREFWGLLQLWFVPQSDVSFQKLCNNTIQVYLNDNYTAEQSTLLQSFTVPFFDDLDVRSSTVPFPAGQTNGNCNHVEVDLNSLNRFENEIRMMRPSSVARSMWTTKYLPAMGLKRRYRYRPVRPKDCVFVLGICM